jgi:hypothetical protein
MDATKTQLAGINYMHEVDEAPPDLILPINRQW